MKSTAKLVFVLLLFCLTSCEGDFSAPQFLLSKPECVLTSKTGSFDFAGVSFSFCNKRNVSVTGFEIQFSVFATASGENPFFKSNVVSSHITGTFLPDEIYELEISLDQYLREIPSNPYFIDHFFVKSVSYADGFVWRNDFGAFYL